MARKRTRSLGNGEPFVIDPMEDEFIHICCECDLTHRVELEVTDDRRVLFRWFRDNRRTAAFRRPKRRKTKWRRS